MVKYGLTIVMFILLGGCAAQELALLNAEIQPAKPSPGENLNIMLKVVDSEGVVNEVVATVRQSQDLRINLNDNGENGDTVAGDGIWSVTTKVPRNAPPGVYNIDFKAYDAVGNRLKLITEDSSEDYLSAEVSVEVVR